MEPNGLFGSLGLLIGLVVAAVVALFGGKFMIDRGKDKVKKEGAQNESVRRENAGKAAELDVAKKDAAIAQKAANDRLLVKDSLRDRLAREPTEEEVRVLIEESKR